MPKVVHTYLEEHMSSRPRRTALVLLVSASAAAGALALAVPDVSAGEHRDANSWSTPAPSSGFGGGRSDANSWSVRTAANSWSAPLNRQPDADGWSMQPEANSWSSVADGTPA